MRWTGSSSPPGTSDQQPDERDTMLAALGLTDLAELVDQAMPQAIRLTEPLDLPPALSESQTLDEAAPARRGQPPSPGDDRARLLRHHHAVGDPAQRARVAGLVHRVHPLPARDQPGPARGAAQLPDHGLRPDRAADRRSQPAGRGDRGRRGDDPGPAFGQDRPGAAGRRRRAAADLGRGAHPGRRAGHRGGPRRRSAERSARPDRRVRRGDPDARRERPAGRNRRAPGDRRPGPRRTAPW